MKCTLNVRPVKSRDVVIQGVDFSVTAAEELVHCDRCAQASVNDVTSSLGEVKVECFEVTVGELFF